MVIFVRRSKPNTMNTELDRKIDQAAEKYGCPTGYIIGILERSEKGGFQCLKPIELEIVRDLLPPQTRPCNGCSVCCVMPGIDPSVILPGEIRIEKPACVACPHINSKGCGIYSNRPEICKGYMCLWSIGFIPEEHHPEEVGVCWTIQVVDGGESGLVVGHCGDTAKALADQRNVEVIVNLLASGQFKAVTVRSDKDAVCFPLGAGGRCKIAKINQSDPMLSEIDESTERFGPYRIEKVG